MALAQAQQEVKQLADKLARGGAEVKYAIHPVAGRMPGHMNVLLAEANVDYDSLDQAKQVIICNYDLKPGYAGVENPLYSRSEGVTLLIGDAKKTLSDLIDTL